MSTNPNPILAYCACGKEQGFCPTTCRRCLCNPCGCGEAKDDCEICEEREFVIEIREINADMDGIEQRLRRVAIEIGESHDN